MRANSSPTFGYDDYWGRDLPVNVGRYNFDSITIDYFLDKHVQKESLKADVFDVILEDVAKDWQSTYNVVERERGLLVKDLLVTKRPEGFPVAYMWNLRRPKFQDIRFREALWWLRDFEWSNRVMFHDFYLRADSYFTNTDFSHSGTLPSAAELELLEPIRDQVPERVFTDVVRMPETKGLGVAREHLVRADRLLTEAGWVMQPDGQRYHAATGEPLTMELMHPADNLERVGRPYVAALEKMGFKVTVRTVEPSNYINRLRRRKFDATIRGVAGNYMPAADLYSTYSSAAADIDSSNNLMGVSNPAVDYLVEKVSRAKTRADLITATRALDRVLSWNFYGIPGFYAPGLRYVYWSRFSRPERLGVHRTGFPDTWWYDEEKAAVVARGLDDLEQQQ